MRRINRIMLLSFFVALCVSSTTFAQSSANVQVRPIATASSNVPSNILLVLDGKLVEASSVEMAPRGQQVLVWVRDLEKLGWGSIQPGPAPGQTMLKGRNVTLTFTKGQSLAMVNSLAVQLPINTDLRNGKLMVPLSFVAKSLGYSYDLSVRPVVSISTTPPTVIPVSSNSIHGQVLFAGKGIKGIKITLVDPDYKPIKGAITVTDLYGNYAFDSLPDGKYLAYVWVGANPGYFNRVSEEADLTGGTIADMTPISLGKVLLPIKPRAGEVVLMKNGRIIFAWAACEGTASYKLTVTKQGSTDPVLTATTTTPRAEMVTKRLAPGIKYDIDVQAEDANGEFLGGTTGVGMKAWSFTVKRVQ